MTKQEFIKRAVLALMGNPNPALDGFRSEDIDEARVRAAEDQWAELVRRGYVEKTSGRS